MEIPNSSAILQAVVEATPDAIFVKDLDGRYILVNRAAARFIGKSPADILGKHDLELYALETAHRFLEADRQVLATGQPQAFQGVATGAAGQQQAYLVTKGVCRGADGRIIGLYGISHDTTELEEARETLNRTREALFQSQKLEAVGQLTGGIAHDFNNILTIILGNVELLKLHVPADPYTDEIISTVLRSTLHGRDLTSHLLAFSRRRLLNPQSIDLDALVGDVARVLRRTLGGNIRVETDLNSSGAVAFVDPSALEAAVLNVALNARDAVLDGGSLTLRTSRVEIPASAGEGDLRPGSYAVLALEDTGHGMSAEVLARAFEPFFTTKAGGHGTGLGLSMVYGFAMQSGGAVTIASTPGQGTTVTLFLPLGTREAEPIAATADPGEAPARCCTILVVEDEADVRSVVRRQLESLGHRVVVAEAASEALQLLKGSVVPDLLLADVVLASGMSGIDLVQAARAERPDLPVIFMSGYTAVSDARERIRETGAQLLAKPFTTPQLDRAVNAACAQLMADG